jgi:hypothetical protein
VAASLLGTPGGPFGGLQLGDDAGEPLGQGVVHLAGHALALVEHTRLAGLVSSWACSPAFSSWAASSRRSSSRRCLSSSISFIPMKLKNPLRAVWSTMMKAQPETAATVGSGNPPGAV